MQASTPAAALAADLRVAVMRTARRVRQQRSSDQLSDTQYSVLAVVDRHGPQTPGALAEHERVQPPSMTRTIGCLVEQGLLTRTPNVDDRRQIVVDLTPAGRTEVVETRRRRTAWLAEQVAALGPDDRATLERATALLLEMSGR